MANVFTGGVSKADAAHLNIQAHSAMDYINGIRDYENHISGLQATQKIAAGAVKATGLDWWGKMGKRTWAGDMLNLFASQAGNTFDKLEPNFQRLLSAYGFSPAEWDRLRAPAMQLDLNGARYLNPNVLMVTERPLYDRVMNAITEQGAFAMHQPDARLRSIETGLAYGATGRTQEFFRSFMQFKTFALSRMTTQLMRVFTDGPIENRIARGAAFVIASTAAGAAAMNAKQILNGKDPYDMHHPKQWLEAFAVGGAGGFYTDLINAAMRGEKSSGDMLTELAGPLASAGLDVARLAAAPLRERIEEHAPGHGTTTGRQLVSILRRNTPNTWYTRLAVDRIIYDKLQTLIDPDYRGSWRRMEDNVRKKGSGFWWGPGRNTPDRAPDLGNVWRQ